MLCNIGVDTPQTFVWISPEVRTFRRQPLSFRYNSVRGEARGNGGGAGNRGPAQARGKAGARA